MTRDDMTGILREEADVPGSESLVAHDDSGRTVGFASVPRSTPRQVSWIGLLVDGRVGRRGHGRAIVTALEHRFRGENRRDLRLAVLGNDPGARAFRSAFGHRAPWGGRPSSCTRL